jgi:hypothetical protein
MALIEARKDEIDSRRAAGEELSPLDSYSGVVLEAGYRRRMALQRLVWKATGRGVSLPAAALERVDWQPGIGFFWSVTAEPAYGAKER